MIWGEIFRSSAPLANVEFLRAYAGCPTLEGLVLAVELALDVADGQLPLGALAERVAPAVGVDRRIALSGILRLVWERSLCVDLSGAPIGPNTAISRTPS